MTKNRTSKHGRRRAALLAIGTAVLMISTLITSVAGASAAPASARTRSTQAVTESCTQSQAVVEQLRTMTTSQLEQVFESLPADPPIPQGVAAGYGWLDANASPITIQNLIHPIWQGKSLYTILGINIINDIFVGIQTAPGVAYYASSPIDGRGALKLDWTSYSPFYDDIRMVDPGVYVGFAFTDTNSISPILDGFIPVLLSLLSGANITPDHPIEANVPYGNFLLDFDCPNTWWAS